MRATPSIYDEQADLWNGVAGEAWTEQQDLIDRAFQGIEDLLVEQVLASGRTRLLDVGCGTGGTTLAIARALGPDGSCVGVDVSKPMLALAEARGAEQGARARFIHADAQRYAFAPASFDMIVSRFGIMFFDDPVAAFANLRHAASEDAELRLIAWRSAEENPFMTTAEVAAAPLLDGLPARDNDGPGQFAFADEHRVRGILAAGGWEDIAVRPVGVACSFPANDLARYVAKLGPVGRALAASDERTRARVLDAVLPAFDHFVEGEDVRFTAACWLISARL